MRSYEEMMGLIMDKAVNDEQIRAVMMDDLKEIQPMGTEERFHIHKPSQMEYDNVCNEFRWLSFTYLKDCVEEKSTMRSIHMIV